MRVVRQGAMSLLLMLLGLSFAAPGAAAFPRVPHAGAGVILVDAPVPARHPGRAGTTQPIVNEAPSVAAAGTVPLPPSRPGRGRVVGRIADGAVVPVAPSAYAPAAPAAPSRDGNVQAALTSVVPVAPPALATHTASVAKTAPAPTFTAGRWSAAPLKRALDALKADRYDQTLVMRGDLKDPLDRAILDYYLTRSGSRQVPAKLIAEFAAANPQFPTPSRTRASLEAALSRENTPPATAKRIMGGRASTPVGMRLLVRERVAAGDRAGAQRLLRSLWHNEPMGSDLQASIAKEFGALLSVDDHLVRIDKLIAENRLSEARALRPRLGNGPRAYVDARVAAAQGANDAAKRLKAVPATYARRPGFALAKAEVLRRADDFDGAAKTILAVSPNNTVDGDAFWTEARIVARSLHENGQSRRAYQLASRGYAEGRTAKADEAFHAGWFALSGLGNGTDAERHFAELERVASYPISLSRAAYWRARAAQKRGDTAAADRHFRTAATYGFTYYGQLARETLRLSGTGVPRGPNITAADRAAISQNALAEAVRRLVATGHEHRIWPFIDRLSETVPTAGQVALATELARKAGYPHLALMAAKEGQRRGLDVGRIAYPTTEIPKGASMPVGLDRALVYSIARQESLFNTSAVSPAGARGLMQVMPRTGSAMARELKLRHSTRRLTSDPAYNATIGAAYLNKRLGEFNGSYIMTFAAYNAGAGRVKEWVERFGDPRSTRVDVVEWIEEIPYPETRNYVMRVLENVQVYREALGTGRLAIKEDLARGRAS